MNADTTESSAAIHRRINDLLLHGNASHTLDLISLVGELRIAAHREGLDDGKRIYKQEPAK